MPPRRRAGLVAACALLLALAGTLLAAPADAAPATGNATTASSTAVSSTAASAGSLATVSVMRSAGTVYPVKDGYVDSVRFGISATDAAGTHVPVVGTAVLTSAGTTVAAWPVDAAMTVIGWNGRVAGAIRTGSYTLTVIAWSTDGMTHTGRAMVRVSGKRLVRHVVVTSTRVDRHTTVGHMPAHLLKAFTMGRVQVRIRTVAVVRGPAKLVFTNNGVTRTVTLRSGTRTTPLMPVPQGFNRVVITHRWARGAAKLQRLEAVWVHYDLR